MQSYEYIEKVKKVMNLETDYKVCKMMKWPTNRATMYKNGQSMDNEAARQIAEILEIPVWTIIADMEAQRQKDPSKKKAWSKLAKMTKQAGGVSTNLLINMALFSSAAVYCILCKIAPHKTKHICDVSPSYQII